jgi:hypothetical protein
MKLNKHKLVDFTERVGVTAGEAFLAVAIVSGVGDLSGLKIAGTAAALAAGKFALVQANKFLASQPSE